MIISSTFLAAILLGSPLYVDRGPALALRVCFVRRGNIYAAERVALVNQTAAAHPTWRLGVLFEDPDLDEEYGQLLEELLSGTRRAPARTPKRQISLRHRMQADLRLQWEEVPEPGPDLFRFRFGKDAFSFTRSIIYGAGNMGSAGNYVIEQDRMLNKPTAIPRILYLRAWPVEGPLRGDAAGGPGLDWVSSSLDPKIKESRLKNTYCDFLPIGDKEMLFALVRKDGLSVWRGKYLTKSALALEPYDPSWGGFAARRPCSWALVNKAPLKCGWHEPFWLFGDERSLFLTTESGQVYLLKLFKDRPPEMKLLWPAKPAPVSLIVSDADSGRTFAFAPEKPRLFDPDTPELFDSGQPVPAPSPRAYMALPPGSLFELAENIKVMKYGPLENLPQKNDASLLRVMGRYVDVLQWHIRIGANRK